MWAARLDADIEEMQFDMSYTNPANINIARNLIVSRLERPGTSWTASALALTGSILQDSPRRTGSICDYGNRNRREVVYRPASMRYASRSSPRMGLCNILNIA